MGFEPTISVLEWAKTVPASDRAATVIGNAGRVIVPKNTPISNIISSWALRKIRPLLNCV
jgi:hypothetical protein